MGFNNGYDSGYDAAIADVKAGRVPGLGITVGSSGGVRPAETSSASAAFDFEDSTTRTGSGESGSYAFKNRIAVLPGYVEGETTELDYTTTIQGTFDETDEDGSTTGTASISAADVAEVLPAGEFGLLMLEHVSGFDVTRLQVADTQYSAATISSSQVAVMLAYNTGTGIICVEFSYPLYLI